MRLIDADALRERWETQFPPLRITDAAEVLDTINDAPTVDAVPVVRCRDCRYQRPLNRKNALEDEFVEGCVWCRGVHDGRYPEDFCSDGERRNTDAQPQRQ